MNAFIDLSETEQVQELAKYTGSLLKDQPDFLADCTNKIKNDEIIVVLELLIKNSASYYTGPKDPESIFNSISRLLCVYKPEESQALVQTLAAHLASDTITGHELKRAKILGNLFNNLDRSSPSRFDCFYNLLSLAGRAGQVRALASQFPKIESWVQDWQISEEQVRTLYRKVYEVLAAAGNKKEACKYLQQLLQTYESTSGVTLAGAKDDAIKLIVLSLGEPTTYEVDNVVALKAVAQLENEVAFELINTYSQGNLAKFQDWTAKHPTALADMGLDVEELTHKVRLLNLAYICAGHNTVAFGTIASALSIDESAIEEWVIDLIRVGLVEAKVDQVNSQVIVSRSIHGSFEDDQWAVLKAKLGGWQRNIVQVQRVLTNVRIQMEEAAQKPGGRK